MYVTDDPPSQPGHSAYSSPGAPAPPSAPEPPATVFALEDATIADITAAFDADALSCQQLTQLYLNRIAAYDDDGPRLNSIITVNPRALDTAQALDEERASTGPRSALHCIPVLLKDNIDTDDYARRPMAPPF